MRGERLRHLGPSGRSDGGRVHAFRPGRPPAHRPRSGGRPRASTRDALLPRHRQPGLRASEAGGMLFGGYEADPVSRWEDGVPWEHGSRPLPPDEDRFRPLWQGAIRRFPFLNDAGMVKLVCHPDAMTPDGNPLLGPMPGVPGLLDGGRPFAQRLRRRRRDGEDHRGADHGRRVRARRPPATGPGASAARTATPASRPPPRGRSTATTTAFAIRSTRTSGGGRSGSGRCMAALQELGAVFGTKNGWERADYLRPGGLAARGRRPAGVRLDRPPYLDSSRRSIARCASASGSST